MTRLTLIALMAFAFALSSCGKKGPLQPPPHQTNMVQTTLS